MLTFQGADLNYSDQGKGTAVLLLHGFCETSHIWDEWKTDLLEEDLRVITLDLPGYGRSDEPLAPPTIDNYADAALAVLDELRVGRCIGIGHSMGGYAALSLAERHPERLLGFGLFHSHPYADSEEKRVDRERAVQFIGTHGSALFAKQIFSGLFADHFASSHPFLIDKLSLRTSRCSPATLQGSLRAMAARPDRSSVLAESKVPVLLINGELDDRVPFPGRQEQLALPAVAEVIVLSRVGHMGQYEAERATQLAVRRFVRFCEERAGDGN